MNEPLTVYPVRSTSGIYIELESGRKLIDGMSSWWCAVHGYNHRKLIEAAKKQIEIMPHVMFGGLTHEPAVELSRKLVEFLPEGLDRIFYSDSGSVAVEVAIKMALQYMQAAGNKSKTKIATVKGGYHGDTWHAMSVCDPVGGMHTLYAGRLPIQFFAEKPSIPFGGEWNDADISSMEKLLSDSNREIAAVIIEPVVQGAGGMWFYHPEYLVRLRELCDRYDILLIADEIATGFYRTGKLFGFQWAGIVPDIICLGKALTGGFMSFAATAATKKVADVISGTAPHAFMHVPTFMGNPLACTVANASLELIAEPGTENKIKTIEGILKRNLCSAADINGVRDIRVLGAIGIIKTDRPVNMERFQKRCVEEGVWIRPFGRLVYIMPPYIIGKEDLEFLCDKMLKLCAEKENLI